MPKKITGCTRARLYTPPARTLTRRTSRGYEVAEFAEIMGEPLLPWQRWAAVHALETTPGGRYRFRVVLILVARQNGKSQLLRTITLWNLYMNARLRVLGVAQDTSLARDQWQMCQDTIHECPDLEAEWGGLRSVNGDERFWLANGSRYAIKAANRKAGRGGSNDQVNIDELREQRNWKAWAALSKTTMARENSLIFALSNAGDEESEVLNRLREVALAGTDPTIGIFEWSAPENCELDDLQAWRQANPGLGHTISLQAIKSALATDPPNVFRTEVLCQKVDQLDGAVDISAWRSCADATGSFGKDLRRRLAACFDVAPDGQHATLSVAAAMADGRVRVEVVKAWKSVEDAFRELDSELSRVKPAATAWYPSGPGGAFSPLLRKRKETQYELQGTKAAEACQELADMAKARLVVHPGDPLLDAHVMGAQKLPAADGWRFTRRGGGHVDAAYSAAGAVHTALTMPSPKQARIRVISY